MLNLESMIGTEIKAIVPFLHETTIQRLILHGVEDAGIWVESQAFTNQLLETFHLATSPKTAVFFLPWHQIVAILGSLDSPSLSEREFGV
jgi:hypothetical protein